MEQDKTNPDNNSEELKGKTELLERIFSTTHLLIACMDTGFNFIRVNRAYAEADGRDPEFFVGKNHFDLYPYGENESIFRRVVETGEPYSTWAKPFEYAEHPERGTTYWDWTLHPIKNFSGSVNELLLCLVDVTERIKAEEELGRYRDHLERIVEGRTAELTMVNKQLEQEIADRKLTEDALRESEELHRITLSNISDAIFITDDAGFFTYICPNVDFIFSYSPQEVGELGNISKLLGEKLFDLADLESLGEIQNIERTIGDKSGQEHALLINVKRVSIKGGTVLYTCRDITERRWAEEEIRKKNEFLDSVLESLSSPFYVIDAHDYTIKMANSAARLGELSVNSTCYNLTHGSDRLCGTDEHPCPVEEIKRTKRPMTVEHIHYDIDGNARNIEVYGYPVFDDGGNIIQVIEYCLDVTKRRQAEGMMRNALKEAQQRQAEVSALLAGSRAVLEYSEFPDAARAIFDFCKKLIGATAGYTAVLSEDGKENELLFLDTGGLPCDVDPSLPMPIRGLRGEAYRTGKTVYDNEFAKSQWMKYMPLGHVKLDNVLFAPLMIEGKASGLLGLANKPGGFNENDARLASAFGEFASIALHNSRTLESLESSEQHFRSVVQTASDAIITANSNGHIVFWNYRAELIFGYSADEVIGRPITILMPEQFRKTHQGGVAGFSLRQKHSTGVEIGKFSIMGTVIECVGLRKNGIEFPIELSLATWKAKEDIFFTAIIRDITERKEEEARKVAEQEQERQRALSMRSDRLRSLGEMAAGIAHELNQPLQGVRGMAERLLISINRGWELTEETISDRANTIIEQADRMVHIIDHIRVFAREAGKPELRPAQINDVVRTAMDMLGTQFRSRGIQLECELTESIPVILANPFSLEEVVINLLVNARDAVEEQMQSGSVSTPPRVILHTLVDQSGERQYAKIEVVDNGIGIPEYTVERVFDPFFTTKGPDKGTGLGLSISKSIVEGFNGTLNIQSTYGSGTVVTISLPVEQN